MMLNQDSVSFLQFLDMLVEDLKSSLALKQFEKARQLVSDELHMGMRPISYYSTWE